MAFLTIQAAPAASPSRAAFPAWGRGRPLALIGAGLAALEFVIALAGGRFPLLSGLVLCVAPGLALVPLLPAATRASWGATLAAIPVVGFAASTVLLVTLPAAGISLTGVSTRVALGALIAAAVLLLPPREPRHRLDYREAWAIVGLLATLFAGILLQNRVIGHTPVPGNDWGQYVLYADQVRIHGSLLIQNPFWMGGTPFRQDPGVPSVFASYLLMSGQPASVLMHGIWAFALMGIAAIFALGRTLWGALTGVLAASLWAVLPIAQDLLGWHGLANDAGLALMTLVLLYVATLVSEDGLGWLEAAGLGLSLVALCAVHRLSFLVTCAGVALAVGAALLVQRDRRGLVLGTLRGAVAALVICAGVAYTVIETDHKFGGTQGYRAYLSTKVHLHLVVSDLSWVLTIAGLGAFVLALWWLRRDRTLLPFVTLLVVVVALAYSWVVHFPLAYIRMAYYVPLGLVPLLAVAVTRLVRPRLAALAAVGLTLGIAVPAWGAAANVHRFYDFANPATLAGMRAVSADLRPGDVVVADRCWSFLSAWLLQTDTLPALDPADILPKAEVRPAGEARAILAGGPRGRALARRLHVRFILVNPVCVREDGTTARPPKLGTPFFVSSRLVAMRLGR
ncbi:MAG TPA: hypothetical protein VF032_11610 [Thermoleophilaceae bacterium]